MSRQLEPPEALLTKRLGSYEHEYTERDLALYALGLGCGVNDLKCVVDTAAAHVQQHFTRAHRQQPRLASSAWRCL